MLSKKYRMKEREVKLAMKRGKPIFGTFFTCIVFPNRYTQNHRLAIVAGNKHTKSAVLRNAYRRSIYTASKELIETPTWRKYDIVLITKKGVKITKEFLDAQEYKKEVTVTLQKLTQKK